MDSDEELEFEEKLMRGNSSTVPGVPFQNRFSPLVESPIVRETQFVRRGQEASSVSDDWCGGRVTTHETASTDPVLVPLSTGTPRVPSHDSVPIGHHCDEEADRSSVCHLRQIMGFVVKCLMPVEMTSSGRPVMVEVPPVPPSVAVMIRGFVALDDWDLEEVFSRRGSLDAVCAQIFWGSFRVATKLALDEIVQGNASGNELQQERG